MRERRFSTSPTTCCHAVARVKSSGRSAAHPEAAARFEALDKTARYRIILPLLKARTPAGRASRLAKAISDLSTR
ncbi:YdeI/OmpD-associated family protein [Embleya sp. NBC_00896]|uniref:YdeI/OmpD-associated family protein n=1 Tax=Embleya sp. NBC_00896 TaxID=2975961 RepID=UPI002F91ABEC|nr:YdeI/OmpD-associated family protein [Embleya sp. NBC_00896]